MKNQYWNKIVIPILAAAALCGVRGGIASDNSATVLPAEGNVQCNDYAANKIIFSMDTNSPAGSGTVNGAENPADADSTGESASYTITGGTSLSFTDSTTPVDYAVIKSGRTVSIAMYPSGGVTEDANLTVADDGVDQSISAFSLCYGLGNEPPPPPPTSVTKSCNLDAILDATGIECPADGSRTLVCNLELDKTLFGANDGSDVCCLCNAGASTRCDEGAPAGDPNACPSGTGTKDGTEVTTHIEINNDPYYCFTVAGTRRCYPY